MHIGHEDHSTLIGNGVLARYGGEGAPLLEVEGHLRVGDEAMALGVGGRADEDPAKHGMAAVPFLRLDRGAPAPLGQLRMVRAPVSHCPLPDVIVGGGYIDRSGTVRS